MIKFLLQAGALVAASIPTSAIAQLDAGKSPPPVQTIDRNSVDLKSGEFVGASVPIGLGSAEASSLSYASIDINYNTDIGTPLTGWVMYHACSNNIQSDCYRNYFTARLGNKSLTFYDDGSDEIHAYTGEVLSLADGAIYDNDDTKWDMGAGRGGAGPDNAVYQVGSLQRITYRDGRTITFSSNAVGDRTIVSNDGYALAIKADRSEVRLINTAIDYCGSDYSSCENSRAWPTFRKSGPAGNTFNDATVYYDDPLLRRTTVRSVVASNGLSQTHTITRPGGLIQIIGKASRQIFWDGWTGHSIFPVVSYSDQYGSSAYVYTGDVNGNVVSTVANYSDGSVVSRASQPLAGTESRTDEIGRTTGYTFNVNDMQPWSYGPIMGDLVEVRSPEQTRGKWFRDSYGNITQSWALPKPNSGLSTATATAAYPHCANRKLCHLPQYIVDARGARTDFTYDPVSGMMLTKTAPPDADGVRLETRYSYQQLQAVYKQAPGGAAAPSGSPIWKLVSTSTCRTMAGASCVGSSDEVRTTVTYNGNLLPETTTVQNGDGGPIQTTTRGYDAVGNVEWIDGPAPGISDRRYYFFDAARQPIGEIGPDPDDAGPLARPAIRRQFNPDGLPISVQSGTATGVSRASLDAMTVLIDATSTFAPGGRKLMDEVAAGGVTRRRTQYSYDSRGSLKCTAVRMDPSRWDQQLAEQADACVPQLVGPNGPDRIERNFYDAAGQLVQVRRAVGTPLEEAYATYSYTPNGKREFVVDANGNKAQLTYDGFDRLKQWRFPSKAVVTGFDDARNGEDPRYLTALSTAGQVSSTDYEEYDYDANGNRKSLRKRDGRTITFDYDALNRVTAKYVPDSCVSGYACTQSPANAVRDVFYRYDLRGLQVSAAFDSPTGADAVTSAYDGFGRLSSSTTSMGGVSRTLGFEYDDNGNRKKVTHPGGAIFDFEYDGLDRLKAVRNGSQVLESIAYNAAGLRESQAGGNSTTSYGYDPIGRLASIGDDLAGAAQDLTTGFGYNPASQIISRSRSNPSYAFGGYANVNRPYTVNGLNQYATVGVAGQGGFTYGYDANGNLASYAGKDAKGADITATFTYDAENRLVNVSGEIEAQLTYDPLGRLWQVSGGHPSQTTQFLYDGDQLSAEYDASGALLRRYVHGTGEDDPLVWYEGSQPQWLHADHQGSIVSVTDASGAAIETNDYDEYGVPDARNIGRFQYTGQAWIPELGMYHYKARIYSPTLGRFLQTDPIGYEDQINLYAYVANDPINNRDPSGNGPEIAGCAAFGPGAPVCAGVDLAGSGLVLACAAFCKPVGDWISDKIDKFWKDEAETPERPTAKANPDGTVTGSSGKQIPTASGGPRGGKRFKDDTPEKKEEKAKQPCEYCGRDRTSTRGQGTSAERDHSTARSQGGSGDSNNETPACRDCNRSKGSQNVWDWVAKKFGFN